MDGSPGDTGEMLSHYAQLPSPKHTHTITDTHKHTIMDPESNARVLFMFSVCPLGCIHVFLHVFWGLVMFSLGLLGSFHDLHVSLGFSPCSLHVSWAPGSLNVLSGSAGLSSADLKRHARQKEAGIEDEGGNLMDVLDSSGTTCSKTSGKPQETTSFLFHYRTRIWFCRLSAANVDTCSTSAVWDFLQLCLSVWNTWWVFRWEKHSCTPEELHNVMCVTHAETGFPV